MRLRDYTPRGYNARHILILIVPMMIFVTAMTWFFFNTHVQQVNAKLSRSFAQELVLAAETRAKRPENWDAFAADMKRSQLMTISFSSDPSVKGPPPGRWCCEQLEQELTVSFGRNFSYAFQPETDLIEVRTQVGEGTLIAKLDRKRVEMVTAPQFIGWSVGFSILLLTTSYLFLRNQVRSILQLSWAADAFGRGED